MPWDWSAWQLLTCDLKVADASNVCGDCRQSAEKGNQSCASPVRGSFGIARYSEVSKSCRAKTASALLPCMDGQGWLSLALSYLKVDLDFCTGRRSETELCPVAVLAPLASFFNTFKAPMFCPCTRRPWSGLLRQVSRGQAAGPWGLGYGRRKLLRGRAGEAADINTRNFACLCCFHNCGDVADVWLQGVRARPRDVQPWS